MGGDLESVKVWHDGSGFGADWFLDKIVVTHEGEETVFVCNKWLSDSKDDQKTERILYPFEKPPETPVEEAEYSLAIYTGDEDGGGTDADVSVQLFGAGGGDSGTHLLDKEGHDDFEQGHVGDYKITCGKLGKLEKLRIWHDGSGFGSDWFLEKVEVTHEGEVTVFVCNQWLSDSREGATVEKILYPKAPEQIPECDYEFSVYTGDVSGAGTDSKVSMTLFGSKRDSGVLNFDKEGQDDFERASKGVYTKRFKDVGELQKLKVWHDGTGFGAGWFLDKVVVKTESGQETVFVCNRWLDKNEDDNQTERTLTPHVPEGKPKQSRSYFAEGFSDSEDTWTMTSSNPKHPHTLLPHTRRPKNECINSANPLNEPESTNLIRFQNHLYRQIYFYRPFTVNKIQSKISFSLLD